MTSKPFDHDHVTNRGAVRHGSATAACNSTRSIDMQHYEALREENAVLSRELATVQLRVTRQAAIQAQRIESQQAELVRLRAELIRRDTALALVRQAQEALEAAVPGLRRRIELTQQLQSQAERIQQLQRALLQAQPKADPQPMGTKAAPAQRATPAPNPPAVLCVGGRVDSVPLYRQVIEKTGHRFLHHDGSEQQGMARLDNTLTAADWVICQTGCLSHNAYWRVKEHCKRTGKRCVFLDAPSHSHLEQLLETQNQDDLLPGCGT